MNLTSHILVRMGLDKSQLDAGLRSAKHDIRGLKDLAKVGGATGLILGVINGFQSIAASGAEAVAKLSSNWSDRFKAMSVAVDETKGGLSGLVAYLVWIAALPTTFLTRFQGAMAGGANVLDAAKIAFDTGIEERRKRLAAAESDYKEARRESSMEGMNPQQRLNALLSELDVLIAQRDAIKDREKYIKKNTEVEKKFKEAIQAQKQVETDAANRQKESLRETVELENQRAEALRKAVEKMRTLSDAMRGVRDASKNISEALRDRSALTLDEIANSQPVDQYTLEQRNRANNAKQAEQMAKYYRWRGDLEMANSYSLAALGMLRNLPGLAESARNPMAALQQSMSNAEEHLRRLVDDEQSKGLNVNLNNTQ